MNNNITEKKDVQRFLDGDRKLNDILYEEIIAFLFSLNQNNSVRINNIKDIAQNSLLILLLNLKADRFKYESTLNTYAKAIAKKQFWKYVKDQQNKVVDISDPALIDEYVENEPDLFDFNKVRWMVYNLELKNLHKDCRRLLKYITLDYSYEEIASRMGIEKHEKVREKVYRCKSKLVKLMNNNPLLIKARNYERRDF